MIDTPDTADARLDDDDEDAPETAEGGEAPATTSRWQLPKRRTLMMAAAPALLLLAGAGYLAAGQWGVIGSAHTAPVIPVVYYDLPEMVVNLSASDQHAQYLKLKVSLEASDPEILRTLDPLMPRVLDMFQLYLRELRTSDLEGSAAVFRLKEELLRRINMEIHPAKVDRVLFKEIIVQ